MVKKIFKWIWRVFLVTAIALIIWRTVSADVNTVFTSIMPTENASAAADAGGSILTHRMTQSISDNGFMKCYNFIYIPDSGEVQISVKYNKSIYEHVPSGERFDFKLYTTSEEKSVFAKEVEYAEKGIYGYCRAVFEGVEFTDEDSIEIIMTSEDRIDEYSVYRIHEAGFDFKNYKLSAKEKASLRG